MELDLDAIRHLCGFDDEIAPSWVVERAGRECLQSTLLSLAARDGLRLGRFGRALTDLYDARRAANRGLREICESAGTAHQIKGAGIEAFYPDGISRYSRDIDIVMPDPDELWAAATAIAAKFPADVVVTVIDSAHRRDWMVALNWPSPESDLDPPHGIDLSTVAFMGEGDKVPVRPEYPDDPVVAGLLLIAEEGFQQPPRGRDVLDAAVLLSRVPETSEQALIDAAIRWLVAPELSELCRRVVGCPQWNIPQAARLDAALAEPVRQERSRRVNAFPATTFRYGLPLDGVLPSPTAEVDEFERYGVLRSPLGGFLLVTTAVVPPDLLDEALSHYPAQQERPLVHLSAH